MVLKRWEKGSDGETLRTDIMAEIPAGTQVNIQIVNDFEIVQYDDTTLTAQQRAALISLLNSNSFTDVS